MSYEVTVNSRYREAIKAFGLIVNSNYSLRFPGYILLPLLRN